MTPATTPADGLDLDALEKHVAYLRHKAEGDALAAREMDPEDYEPDDPVSIQMGLEFSAETATKSADAIESLIARIRELERAEAQAVPEVGMVGLRPAVEAMVTMLETGEWAEHVASTTGKGNPLAQRLEDAITKLHNEISHE